MGARRRQHSAELEGRGGGSGDPACSCSISRSGSRHLPPVLHENQQVFDIHLGVSIDIRGVGGGAGRAGGCGGRCGEGDSRGWRRGGGRRIDGKDEIVTRGMPRPAPGDLHVVRAGRAVLGQAGAGDNDLTFNDGK